MSGFMEGYLCVGGPLDGQYYFSTGSSFVVSEPDPETFRFRKPEYRQRTWRERLLSRPWRPWVCMVQKPIPMPQPKHTTYRGMMFHGCASKDRHLVLWVHETIPHDDIRLNFLAERILYTRHDFPTPGIDYPPMKFFQLDPVCTRNNH